MLDRGVISVVRTTSARTALTLARGVARTGVVGVEVTMTVPDAVHVIATLVDEGVDRVGAGTVRTLAQMHACIDAGATFIVSPHLDADLVKVAVARGVPVVPGCLTPSEIAQAMALGASAVKLFPVSSVGGVAFVRAVLEPMPEARFVVSGEVTLPEVDDYLAVGAWAACIGPGLWRPDDVESGDVESVAAYAAEMLTRPRPIR
ncbi:bifunctional 4-hydroxy-2-oxoglutarate aldolase/2-dehydro-3-deoxy-phosphogluconate aldolase [Asanoa sp. NPDC049573]|uniref:bifunctional 4-hydroxy-2-oxoglutarate aldolase/2-dehydro-3-deoxy-phosphogluconate aldolase n=1 Tax=Asanoa sp. NPDC049573 TaxID=3155396 RepID=UPI003420CAB4